MPLCTGFSVFGRISWVNILLGTGEIVLKQIVSLFHVTFEINKFIKAIYLLRVNSSKSYTFHQNYIHLLVTLSFVSLDA